MAFYGRHISSSEADYGVIGTNALRGVVFNKITQNLWVYALGGWVGKSTDTNAKVRFAAYSADGLEPDLFLGQTDQITASTSYTGPGGGASVQGNITSSESGPSNTSMQFRANKRYALFALATTAPLGHSMRQASAIIADNESFYGRSGLTSYPQPMSGTSASTEGHMSIWAVGDVNAEPDTPSSGLAPSGTIDTLVPVFTADWEDDNAGHNGGTDRGDAIEQLQIQVVRSSDLVVFWDTGTLNSSSAERAADAVERTYGGTTLVRGTAYKWRIRFSDQFGEWSNWSAYTTFTPSSLGFVTVDATMAPTGKQEAVTVTDFNGKWNHQAALATNAVQVRVKAGGTVQQTSPIVTKTVASAAAPGTAFAITWAESDFDDLSWGTSYTYEIRGRDTNNVWSDWSAGGAFSTNAYPSTPTGLTPSGGLTYTDFPLLEFSMTDADDTAATGLTAVIRITRPDAGTVDVTPTYNATNAKWEFQTTATELDEFGVFSWKATGYDGTIYSGGDPDLADAVWSSSVTFSYSTGPTVTIDSPADASVVAASSFAVTWTSSEQASYWLSVYDDGTSENPVYATGEQVSADTTHTIPSSYIRNGSAYDIVVVIEDNSANTATDIANITATFTPSDTITGFMALPVQIGADPWDTSIQLFWDATQTPVNKWRSYVIVREGGGDEHRLVRITNPAATTFIDLTPVSGVEYTYSLIQETVEGADTIESDIVTANGSVALRGVVLSSVIDGITYRSVLTFVRELSHTRNVQEAMFVPLAGRIGNGGARHDPKPVTIRSRARWWETAGVYELISNDFATAQEQWDLLEALDASRDVICFRDDRGVMRFCRISALRAVNKRPIRYTVEMSLREEDYVLGIP